MGKIKQSDSTAQQVAEIYILKELNEKRGYNLKSQKIELKNNVSIQLDGYNEKDNIICEIYAHIGKLKGSQPDKVASDILKMLLFEKHCNKKMKKILCFADKEVSRYFEGNSWLSYARKKFDIKLEIVELTSEKIDELKNIQEKQNLLNQKVDEQ